MAECSSYFFDMLRLYQKVVLAHFVSKYMEQISQIKDKLYNSKFITLFIIIFIYYTNSEINFSNSQILICALNFRDKEYWLNTLHYNKEHYKNLFGIFHKINYELICREYMIKWVFDLHNIVNKNHFSLNPI